MMFNVLFSLNWIAIVAATVALAVVGGLWFTVFFGKAYAVALGRENQPQNTPGSLFIFGPLVCSFVTVVASSILIHALKIESMGDGLSFGAIVGFGFLTMTTVNTAINPNMPRPLFYGLISGSYFFVSGLITSMILVALK